ncbi:uncharacterized protein LOC121728566 [Aricia agestis]|uniref:uncharacterized protein LOC121728566 n=1 Tax=Aricia agestis TaxID=91739 RepID=UPI001C202228|nr:uncharacterized protein LOC121728566 [Aricia agestis]
MCLLTLILCVGVASSASVYRSGGGQDYEYCGGAHSINENQPPLGLPPPLGHRRQIRLLDDRPVRENYDYGGGGHHREERQGFDRRHGRGDRAALGLGPNGAQPSGDRYGEAPGLGPGRPPAGPPANPPRTERRGFGDRSNEITDESIDRIRTTIYSNVPTDRRPLYADAYGHEQHNFNNRRSGSDNEYRGAGGAGPAGGDDRRDPVADASQSRDDSRWGTSDKNTRREPNTTFGSRGAHTEAAANDRPAEPGANGDATRGRGAGVDSTWVWSSNAETTTTASTTPMDLDNRASFSGDNCPTGQIKVEGKCVETH